MREALTLIPDKAAEERHWDEAEEDDEEDRPTDDTLGLWTVKNRKRDHTVIHSPWVCVFVYTLPKNNYNLHSKHNSIRMGIK